MSDRAEIRPIGTSELLQPMPQRQTFVDEFLGSAKHSLIQAPAEGVAQLSNEILGTTFKPEFAARPKQAEFGSTNWHAQQLGNVAGTLPWLLAIHKGVSFTASRFVAAQTATNVTFKGGMNLSKNSLSVLESGTTGFLYGGVLTPVHPESKDFWADRSKNASTSAVTFAVMTRATQVAKDKLFAGSELTSTPSTFASRATDRLKLAGAGGFGGLVAGPVDSTLHSWMHHRRLPHLTEVAQSAYSFTLIGAGFGALDKSPNARGNLAGDKGLAERTSDIVRPAELTAEQKVIMNGARQFATELTSQFPQVNEKGQLNYYLGGSLGTMLLLEAGSFRPVESTGLPGIKTGEPIAVTPEAVGHLQQFVRRIGDVDYVSMPDYVKEGTRLRKGGGSIITSTLSPEAREALKPEHQTAESVFTDPVQAIGEFGVVEVEVGGKKMYVGSPSTMHAYKLVHLAESLGRGSDKTVKFVNDLNALVNGLEAIYPRSVLDAAAHNIMFKYNGGSVSGLWVPYQVPEFTGQPRALMERVVRMDPDFKYVDSIGYGAEYGLTFLRLMHQFKTPEAKQMVADFIRDNRQSVERWEARDTPHNRLILADFLLRNPQHLEKYQNYLNISEGAQPAELTKALTTHPWILREMAQHLPKERLEMMPCRSELLDTVSRVQPERVAAELPVIKILADKGADTHSLQRLMTEVTDPVVRAELFGRLQLEAGRLQGRALSQQIYQFTKSLEQTQLNASGQWVKFTPEQVNANMLQALRQ